MSSPSTGAGLRVERRARAALLVAAAAVALIGSPACSGSRSTARRTTASVEAAEQSRDPTASVAPRPSAGCGTKTAKAVAPDVFRTALTHDGAIRTYFLQVPDGYDGATPVPVVVDLHGLAEGAEVHLAMSGLPEYGRSHGFATVTPQGTGTPPYWNSFGAPFPDDVAFFGSLLDELAANLCIDTARVFVAGLSNGAFMASLLACELPGRVAAVAAVAGLQFPDECADAPPKPVLAVHGTADTFVGYDGGLGDSVSSLGIDPALLAALAPSPVRDVVRQWAEHDGCAPSPEEETLAADVRRTRYTGCVAGGEVALVTVDGGGHAWPSSAFSARIDAVVGHTSMSVAANDLIWQFFTRHPLP